MTARITRTECDGQTLEKRTYLPFKVASNCPTCGREHEIDLMSDYLSYPVLGQPEELEFACDSGHPCVGWVELVIVDFTLEVCP